MIESLKQFEFLTKLYFLDDVEIFSIRNFFEIYFFYIHLISCIFLCGNENLIITQQLCAILTNI